MPSAECDKLVEFTEVTFDSLLSAAMVSACFLLQKLAQ